MAYYIKANEKVGEHLRAKERNRRRYPDGSWCLWQADMVEFGRPYELDAILRRIGAAKLTPVQSKEEFDGARCTPLPMAEDERWRVEEPTEADAWGTVTETQADAWGDVATEEAETENPGGESEASAEPEEGAEG